MRANSFRGSLWAAVMAMLSISLSSALALQPPGRGKGGSPDDPPPPPVKKTEPTAKPADKPAEKAPETYEFVMRDKPWGAVFEWLTDNTGIPVVSNYKPKGTFNFIGPKGKKYTLPEIIDHINDALLSQPPSNRYILIRRDTNFTLIPAEEKVPIELLPEIDIKDLDKHGNTEMGTIVLALKSLVAEDVAPEVKQLKGTFGEVTAFKGSNKLVLTDTVKNLKRLIKTLTEMDDSEKQADSYSHKCEFIKARDAERVLKELLGDPEKLLRAQQPQQQFGFGGGNGFGGGGFPGQPPRGGGPQPAAAPAQKVRMHYITCDERTNTVLVTGPADKIAQARDIMKKIDVEQKGQSPIIPGSPQLKKYNLDTGNAEAVAKTLKEIYKESATLRISAAGNNTILVYAVPDDQIDIAQHIFGTAKGNKTETISLGTLDSAKIAATLKGIYPDSKSGGPFIEEDSSRNIIVVNGTEEQIIEIKRTIKALGEVDLGGGGVRVLTLDQGGDAASLAEALQQMMPQLRKNPVKVNTPGSDTEKKPEESPKKDQKDQKDQKDRKDVNRWDSKDSLRQRLKSRELSSTQLVALDQADPQDNNKAGKQPSPITLTPLGNKLVISSDDPEAMALVLEMARLLTQPQKGSGRYEIIKLKNASATDAAKVLDEAFNGPKQTSPQQAFGPFGGRNFFNQFGAQGATPPANPSADKIRVVADPGSNSLLIRASPLDMVAVRRLIEKAIDSGATDSKAVLKIWTIGPLQYANATDIATTIKDVYRENINSEATNTQPGGFRGFRFGPALNLNPDGSPKTISLSVGVDDRTNSLVINCSEAMHDDIVKLVKQMEQAAKDTTKTVRLVKVKGVDPTVLQQALDAIQGKTNNNNNNTGQFNGFGGNGRGGFGGGGFGGGGPGMRGGGGGGFNGGGRGRGNNRQPDRGPDFFAQAVMDDPQASVLYDPQQPSSLAGSAGDNRSTNSEPRTTNTFEEEEQQPPPASGPGVPLPRRPFTSDALPELGAIVISADSPADAKLIEDLIKLIIENAKEAEIEIKIVPLQYADATVVVTTLNQLFQRVNAGASGNTARQVPSTTSTQTPFGPLTQSQTQASSVVLIPLARQNAILLAVPRSRVEDIEKEIKRLDVPSAKVGEATRFRLEKASASRVATLINNFYSQRYPGETATGHQIRVTFDDPTNTVFVQAAPADLKEISDLITHIDTMLPNPVNELRIVPLRNALADELSQIILKAISDNVVAPSTTPTTPGGGALGAGGGALGAGGGAFGAGGGAFGAGGGAFGAGGALGAGGAFGAGGAAGGALGQAGGALGAARTTAAGAATRASTLRFVSTQRGVPPVQSGYLEDIHLTPDVRTNTIIISAPPKSMDLLLTLIRELDVPPAARAEINIFQLKKADATATATLLQQLFLGTGGVGTGGAGATTPRTGGGAGGGVIGGGGGVIGGGGGGAFGAGGGAFGAGGGVIGGGGQTAAPGGAGVSGGGARPLQLTLGGTTMDGAPLIELRLTVDERTNSIIVGGSRIDLDVIEALITRLEDSSVQARRDEVYHVRNSSAADIASALQTYLNNSITVLQLGQQLTPFQQIQRQVVVVPEPVSNKLLISATGDYFDKVMKLILQLDSEPPQVMIQVLVAEVDLSNTEEFGMEIGLQSPVLFNRSVIPANNFLGAGTISYANVATQTGNLVPPGVTVNSSINPVALPGFDFNNVITPLGNNPVVNPGVVGFQGINSLGVGRQSTITPGVGGFVFSASSSSFNLLIRALKTQGRIDIMSRPQLMTTDNQTASILIGQSFPYPTGTTVTTGIATTNVAYRDIGVLLNVTPRISPDGKVYMRVNPEVSSIVPTTINLGNGVLATAFNVQSVNTTISAQDGETVAIGGMISKKDQKNENKVPWFGDLPYVGSMFRFRTSTKAKTEVIVILTPHIVRNRFDADRVLAMESRRMDWVVGDAMKIHGSSGMEPILSNHEPFVAPGQPLPYVQPPGMGAQSKRLSNPPSTQINSGSGLQPASAKTVIHSSLESQAPATVINQIAAPPQELDNSNPDSAGSDAAASTDKGKESPRWNIFRNRK